MSSEYFDNRVPIDIAAYHIDWKDIQVGAVVNNVGVLVNGGEASIKWRGVIDRLQTNQRAAHRLQRIVHGSDFRQRCRGYRRAAGQPSAEHPGIPGINYDRLLSPAARRLNSHFGAGLRMVGDRKSVRVFVRNVTDERAYQTIAPTSNAVTGALDHLNGTPIQPRTVGLEVDYRF